MNLLQTMNAEEPGDKPEEGDGPSKLNDTGMPTVEQLQKDLEMLNEIEKAATETNEGENLDEEINRVPHSADPNCASKRPSPSIVGERSGPVIEE